MRLLLTLFSLQVLRGELVSQIFGLIKLQEAVFGSEITKQSPVMRINCPQITLGHTTHYALHFLLVVMQKKKTL